MSETCIEPFLVQINIDLRQRALFQRIMVNDRPCKRSSRGHPLIAINMLNTKDLNLIYSPCPSYCMFNFTVA